MIIMLTDLLMQYAMIFLYLNDDNNNWLRLNNKKICHI